MNNPNARALIYKLSTDDNGAPCIHNNILSLAICKPGYRHVAKKGDFLFGFMGRTTNPDGIEPLLYMAEITEEPISVQKYYTNPNYADRPDCIYEIVNGQFGIKPNALYHNYLHGHIDRRNADLGSNREANVLLSKNFRYFGKNCKVINPNKYSQIVEFVGKLGQTNYPPKNTISESIYDECQSLCQELWDNFDKSVLGTAQNLPSNNAQKNIESEMGCISRC